VAMSLKGSGLCIESIDEGKFQLIPVSARALKEQYYSSNFMMCHRMKFFMQSLPFHCDKDCVVTIILEIVDIDPA
jgi:hypothetical protein